MRLFFLYFLIWLMPLTSSFWYISEFNVGISYSAIIYISSFILILLIFTILMSVSFSKRASMEVVIEKFDVKRLINFQKKLTYLWLLIFVAEVIYSGGLPILWSNKGYESFGIPTIHGFSNMLRGLIISNISLCLLFKFKIPKHLLLYAFFILMSALILEQSRGAFILTLCFGFGPLILFMNVGFKNISKIILAMMVIIPLFSVFQFLRYAESPLEEIKMIADLASSNEEAYRYFLEPILNYIASPVLNAGLNIDAAELFSFSPSITVSSLIPSFIAGEIFAPDSDDVYGLLIDDAFNTTTFITPFINDYGLIGGLMIISFFLFFSAYVYAKAISGSPKHIVAFSAISASLILSIFTSYITTLVIVIYLLISGVSARRMIRL